MPSNGNADQYAPTSWTVSDGSNSFDFTCPSGQMCKLRRLSIEKIAVMGLLDRMDILTNMMNEYVADPAQGKKPQDRKKKALTKAQAKAQEDAENIKAVSNLFSNPAELSAMLGMVDKIVEAVVLAPDVVRPVYVDDDGVEQDLETREVGVVYTDMIAMQDRMAIFHTSFGDMGDLPTFREESEDAVGGVEAEPNLSGVPAEPATTSS